VDALPIVIVASILIFAFVGVPILASRRAARLQAEAMAQVQDTPLPAPQVPLYARPIVARQDAVPGRGLVLASSNTATSVNRNGRRFDRRAMTIEVEVAGMAPYVVQGSFLVPRGQVEAIPGASLELMVAGSSAREITVLGPGGFTGPWLSAGPPKRY
jgi:hypothetical protein